MAFWILNLFFCSSALAYDYCTIKCQNDNDVVPHIACERQCYKPPDDCAHFKNSTLTKQERELILGRHNELRNQVALGEESDLNITASNMNILRWDDELEYIALCWVNTCGKYQGTCFDTKDGKVGYNVAYKGISVETTKFDQPETLLQHINDWYGQVKSIPAELVDLYPSNVVLQKKFQSITQLIWAETRAVGCARSIYGQYLTMFACIYSPAGNIQGQPIFKRGTACSDCPCTSKYVGLCLVPNLPNASTSRTTKTTKQATKQHIAVVNTTSTSTAKITTEKLITTSDPLEPLDEGMVRKIDGSFVTQAGDVSTIGANCGVKVNAFGLYSAILIAVFKS